MAGLIDIAVAWYQRRLITFSVLILRRSDQPLLSHLGTAASRHSVLGSVS